MPAPKGNKNAAHRKPFEKALMRALALNEQGFDKSLTTIANNVVTKALEGEKWAIDMLADRLDGKPKQQTELTGADNGPVIVSWLK